METGALVGVTSKAIRFVWRMPDFRGKRKNCRKGQSFLCATLPTASWAESQCNTLQ